MLKPMRAAISALLLVVLLALPACQLTSSPTVSTAPTVSTTTKVECLGTFLLGIFEVGSAIAEHGRGEELVFTTLHAGAESFVSCYPVFADTAGNPVAALSLHTEALQTGHLQPPAVTTTQLADSCHLDVVQNACTYSTPGFQPFPLTWESTASADIAMTNCSDASVTGTYSYNIPAEMVVGSDSQQKTFIEPIAQIPSNDPNVDALPPVSDTTSDFAAIAQYLYAQDNIHQFFNPPGKYSDSFPVTIPAKMKAHIKIDLLLQYRYGKAVVTSGNQSRGWLWMYIFAFSYAKQSSAPPTPTYTEATC